MSKQRILKTIINDPEPIRTLTVEVEPKGLRKLLVSFRLTKPRTREVELIFTNSSMLTFQRITELWASRDLSSDGSDHMELYNANAPILAAIIATALHNKPTPVPSELVDAILTNFTNEELHNTAQKVYRGLDYTPFYNTMELFLNLMPTDIQETTVHGQ